LKAGSSFVFVFHSLLGLFLRRTHCFRSAFEIEPPYMGFLRVLLPSFAGFLPCETSFYPHVASCASFLASLTPKNQSIPFRVTWRWHIAFVEISFPSIPSSLFFEPLRSYRTSSKEISSLSVCVSFAFLCDYFPRQTATFETG